MAARSCVWLHHVMVVFLGSGTGTDSPPAAKRMCVYRDWKFKDLQEELAAENLGHWTLLQSHYTFPIPYWSESDPNAFLSVACQTIYAINMNGREYVVGVVRTLDTDYPILILDPQTPRTVRQAVSIDPALPDVTSITLYSGTLDIASSPLDYHKLQETESSTFPTVLVITVGEPAPHQLHIDMPLESSPYLQMTFELSMNLLRASYNLKAFTLQMIHVSGCLVHVIVSLAKAMLLGQPESRPDRLLSIDDWTDLSALDLFEVSALLLSGFEQNLDDLTACQSSITSGEFDRDDIERKIYQSFVSLCGEHPGAVTVRHSHATFERLKAFDREDMYCGPQDLSGSITENGDPISRHATDASRKMGGQSTRDRVGCEEGDDSRGLDLDEPNWSAEDGTPLPQHHTRRQLLIPGVPKQALSPPGMNGTLPSLLPSATCSV